MTEQQETVDRTERPWTNLPNDATVLAFPPCARCGGELYGALYSQRIVKTYEAIGVTPDGDVAEFESFTLSDSEDPEFLAAVVGVGPEPERHVVECDHCHEQYAPLVRADRTVEMEKVSTQRWEGDR